MKWNSWLFGPLVIVMIAGCGGERRSDDAGSAGDAAETGTMQGGPGAATDTVLPGGDTGGPGATTGATPSDTAHGGARMHSDTNNPGTTPRAGGTTGTVADQGDTARRVSDSADATSR